MPVKQRELTPATRAPRTRERVERLAK